MKCTRNADGLVVLFLLLLCVLPCRAQRYTAWSAPVNLGPPVNTTVTPGGAGFGEFNPATSSDGLSLYFTAVDRPENLGSFDIWVSHRTGVNSAWGDPVHLGPNVNSTATENNPTISPDGKTLIFESNRTAGAGGLDLYITHRQDATDDAGWEPAVRLGDVVNTAANEDAGGFCEDSSGVSYFFSSGNVVHSVVLAADGSFLARSAYNELGQAQGLTIRRDCLEIFFVSSRTDPAAFGGNDIWTSTRTSVTDPWQVPNNLGPVINSATDENRPSLSWTGTELFFGSNRPNVFGLADFDIFVSHRNELPPAGLYSIRREPVLRRMNIATGELTTVPITAQDKSVSGGIGLALNPKDGALYALLEGDFGFQLATIDAQTGEAKLIGNGTGTDIAFAADGMLYALSTPEGSLYVVDPTSGAATFFSSVGGGGGGHGGGIAFNPNDGLLYHAFASTCIDFGVCLDMQLETVNIAAPNDPPAKMAEITAGFTARALTHWTGDWFMASDCCSLALISKAGGLVGLGGDAGGHGLALVGPPPAEAQLRVEISGLGTVTSDPVSIDCGQVCSAAFPLGSVATLNAQPEPGMILRNWEDACSGSALSCSVALPIGRSVKANFGPRFQLTVTKSGPGRVTSDPVGIDCGANCTASFNTGTQVILAAVPESGYVFAGWSGACTGTSSCTVTINGDWLVTATFVGSADLAIALSASANDIVSGYPLTYQISVTNAGPQIATQARANLSLTDLTAIVSAVSTRGQCSGQDVGEDPIGGWSVDCVLGDVGVGETAQVTIMVRPGRGTTFGAEATISSDSADPVSANNRATKTVTLLPSQTDLSVAIAQSADNVAIGQFAQYSVTVRNGPNPATRIRVFFDGVSPSDTITNASEGCFFTGNGVYACRLSWLDANQSTTFHCFVSRSSAGIFNVIANVGADQADTDTTNNSASIQTLVSGPVMLNVTRSGPGIGKVTSEPAGIDCGVTCSATFAAGSTVILTAVADASSIFVGWSGACTGTASCQLIMAANRSVSATFLPAGAITITSPNGGEQWQAGWYLISWNRPTNLDGTLTIEVLRGGVVAQVLVNGYSAANTAYGWQIPDGQAVGRDYRVRVRSNQYPSLSDTSDADFSIVDTSPPSVSITSHASGRSVSGTVTITAAASDNVGVVGVQFRVDGRPLGAEQTVAPYSVVWDTTVLANGSYVVSAEARDDRGNKGTSSLTMTVSNSTEFAFIVPPGSSSSATTSAGTPASFPLTIAPITGFTGTVAFTCTNLPPDSSCTVTPNPAAVSGTASAPVTVAITTTARSATNPASVAANYGRGPWQRSGALLLALLFLSAGVPRGQKGRRLGASGILLLCLLLVLTNACGGSGATTSPSATTSPPPTGTPAGTYTVTVSGTSAGVTHSFSLTLTVR